MKVKILIYMLNDFWINVTHLNSSFLEFCFEHSKFKIQVINDSIKFIILMTVIALEIIFNFNRL